MTDDQNRRIAEASTLRELFREQWLQLRRRFVQHEKRRLRNELEESELRQAIESVVDGTDSKLRVVGNYRQRLRSSTRKLLDHLAHTLDGLSPVLEIDRAAFVKDAQVASLFASQKKLTSLIAGSPAVYKHLASTSGAASEHLYLLITVARREKSVLGNSMHGTLLVRDVQQKSIHFHSHRLLAVAESEPAIRSALKRSVFEGVVRHIRTQLTNARHGRHVEETDVGALDTPWSYIEALERLLGLPQDLIRLQHNLLQIDSMGIVIPADQAEPDDQLALDELTIGDNASQILSILRYSREEIPAPTEFELPEII